MSKRKSNRVARRLLGMSYWRSNTKKIVTWRSLISELCRPRHGVVFEPNEHLREIVMSMIENPPQAIYFPHRGCMEIELVLPEDSK